MLEGDRSAVLVKSSRDPIVVVGAIDVVLGILLAQPDQLDGAVHLLGDLSGLGDEVDVQASAEAAAEELVLNPDLALWQAGSLGDRRLGTNRDLRRHPDIASVLVHVYGAVHRFHGGVGQKWKLVDGFESLPRR